ncbi:MAG: hypothetical protein EPN86_00615 [Nanoarchaeota archaeon]|nr:MAG: hypothetical protein EPN86_00615 [Nanoarchaeota archaeon]
MKKRILSAAGRKEELRLATPKMIGDYRAQRLACKKLVEIGAGIGSQTLAFSRTCSEVIAVEKNPQSVSTLVNNTKDAQNIIVIEGDIFSDDILSKIKGADVYFCDPSRPLEEKERTIANVSPKPEELVKFNPLAIEMPPQLPPEKIPYDAEKEYISVECRLNRLTLYFGRLKKHNISVVSLPSGEKITDEEKPAKIQTGESAKFIHEVDTAIIKAGLLPQLVHKLGKLHIYSQGKYTILSSDIAVKNSFLRTYEIISKVNPDSIELNAELRKKGFGKAVVHARILPSEYWQLRKTLERGLSGSETAHVFINESEALITKLLQ